MTYIFPFPQGGPVGTRKYVCHLVAFLMFSSDLSLEFFGKGNVCAI